MRFARSAVGDGPRTHGRVLRRVVLEATASEPTEVLELLDIKTTLAREWTRYPSPDIRIIPMEGDHYSIFRDEAGLATMREVLSDVCR